MARLNLGSVAAMVLAAIVVLLLGASSYMVSSRMNRDAETVGNSASAPNSPGGINEQPMKDRHPTAERAALGRDECSARGSIRQKQGNAVALWTSR